MKRFRLPIRVLAVLAAAIGSAGLWGCGSPGNCDTFVEDYCARFSECEPGIYAFLSGGDAATCRARFLPACTQSITIDGAKLSSDVAGQCGKSIRSASCDDLLSGHLPDVCTPPGTRADGASCSDALQCASTRCTGSATTCGSCVPRLKVGEPCQSSDQCQYGLYCKTAGASQGACTAFRPARSGALRRNLVMPADSFLQHRRASKRQLRGAAGGGGRLQPQHRLRRPKEPDLRPDQQKVRPLHRQLCRSRRLLF